MNFLIKKKIDYFFRKILLILIVIYILLLNIQLFYQNNLNLKIFLITQIILCLYFFLRKKFLQIFLFLLSFFIIERFLIYINIINLNYVLTYENIYQPSSAISYLYIKKNNSICNPPLFPLGNIGNQFIYKGVYENRILKIKSDKYGFFNDYKNDYEIIFVGDSFIDGTEISEEKNFVNNLKKIKKIYNLGISQTGPLSQFALIKEYLSLPYLDKVKNIYWFYSEENDLARPYINFENKGGDINLEYSLTELKKYLYIKNYSQNLIVAVDCINNELKKKIDFIPKEKFKNFFLKPLAGFIYNNIKNLKINQINNNLVRDVAINEDYSSFLKIYFEVIKQSRILLAEKNISLTIVILPNKFNCGIKKKHFLNNIIENELIQMGVNFINLNEIFFSDSSCNLNLFNNEGHFSEQGHKKIFDFLKNKI